MHLGMTGWVKFSSEETGYYRSKKESQEEAEWPPKYCKFLMRFEKETVGGEERDEVEVAFIDARRLARIRLVECEAAEIRNHSPLKENGPDPVVDKEKFTVEFLKALLGKKRVPVKALLLDQANISGTMSIQDGDTYIRVLIRRNRNWQLGRRRSPVPSPHTPR